MQALDSVVYGFEIPFALCDHTRSFARLQLRPPYLDILIPQFFFPDVKIAPSTLYRIRCGFIIFHSGERIKKYPDAPNAGGRQPYPGRESCGLKKISEYVWTGRKTNKKTIVGRLFIILNGSFRLLTDK